MWLTNPSLHYIKNDAWLLEAVSLRWSDGLWDGGQMWRHWYSGESDRTPSFLSALAHLCLLPGAVMWGGMFRKWLCSGRISECGAERQTDRRIERWQKVRAESGPGAESTRPPVDWGPGAKCSVNGHLQWWWQDDLLSVRL